MKKIKNIQKVELKNSFKNLVNSLWNALMKD